MVMWVKAISRQHALRPPDLVRIGMGLSETAF
jgi:hypothetical protein